MKIKIDHINITVQDIQESIRWYSKIFGFKLRESGTGIRGQAWSIISSNDCMIAMSEYKNKTKADEAPETNFHKMYHFGIRVPDAAVWEAIVKENKLKLHYGGVVSYPYSRSWYIHDPSGHEIEVSHTDDLELRFPDQH